MIRFWCCFRCWSWCLLSMMTSSNGRFSVVTGPLWGEPVTGGFPSQRPMTRCFNVFFYLRLSKQSRRRWVETPLRSLWRHCNGQHHRHRRKLCILQMRYSTAFYWKNVNQDTTTSNSLGPRLNIKTVFPRYGIPMFKVGRSRDRLIFNMGIPLLVSRRFMLRQPPGGYGWDCYPGALSFSQVIATDLKIGTHYGDVIMGAIASQITSLTIVYSIVYSDAYQRKHQSSASLAFVRGIHRGPVNSPHKWPVTRKMFPFDDVIMGPDLWICCSDMI